MNHADNSFSSINPEVLRLFKSGGGLPPALLKEYLQGLQKPDYPMDFVLFMDQMIKESGLDRKTVIARSGLSESLAYKYLNGNKTTTERDYILAFCIALHLSVPQTEHALRCCGLAMLGQMDPRAQIIRLGIESRLDRYQIDEYLESAGFPPIKVSNDMVSARITDSLSIQSGQPLPAKSDRKPFLSEDEFQVVESSTKALHAGNAPFDYNYFGSMTLKGSSDQVYYLEALYYVTGDTFFYVFNAEQHAAFQSGFDFPGGDEREGLSCFDQGAPLHFDFSRNTPDSFEDDFGGEMSSDEDMDFPEEDEDDLEGLPPSLEVYTSLLDATASAFFPFFMELDQLTDKKVAEVLADVNDSRNYPYRIGSHIIGGRKQEAYIEMFNFTNPERREYFQLVETIDHACTYTASHESYFMRIEMEDLFDSIFTKKREPEYYLRVTDQEFHTLDYRYRIIFNTLKHYLHTYLRDNDMFDIPDEQFFQEEREFCAEHFVSSMRSGNLPLAKRALDDWERTVKAGNLPPAQAFYQTTVIASRRYDLALAEGDPDEISRQLESIISRQPEAFIHEASLGPDASHVFSIIADALLDRWRAQWMGNESSQSRVKLEDILSLMDHGAFSNSEDYCTQRFELFQTYAFSIDAADPDKAEEYYQKALKEASVHHLDQRKNTAAAVAGTYNNYAWVLWNKFGSEEAIIYYGRAIELTESFIDNGLVAPELAKENLAHYGEALMHIYEDTSRVREKDRLRQRLLSHGVKLE